MATNGATPATGPAPAANPAGPTPSTAQPGGLDAAVEAELASMGVDGDGDPVEQRQPEGDEGDFELDAQGEDGEEGEQQEEGEDGETAEQEAIRLGEGEVEYTTEGGKKYALPREVADNMLRHQDYTRNMQQLGEYARQQEQSALQLRDLYQQGDHLAAHRARLNQIDEAEGLLHSFLEQNPNLSQVDELEFNKAVAQLNLLQHHRRVSQGAMEEAQTQFTQFEARQNAERVARVMPVFQNMGISLQHLKAVEGHCRAMGLTQQEVSYLNEARSPGAVMMALESMAYRSLMQQKAKGTSQVNKAKGSGVLRPGTASGGNPRMSSVTQTQKRLQATGSVKDAVSNELAYMTRRARGGRQQ